MKANIIRIGNSRGVRLPKALLEQTGLNGEVDLKATNDSIVIRPRSSKPRAGWAKSFKELAASGQDKLLDPVTSTEWDKDEWEW